MERAAIISLRDGQLRVEITDEVFSAATEALYVWTTSDGTWLRVGTTKRM
jgi:hypothetical protein